MSLIDDIYDINLTDNTAYRGVFKEQFSQYYKNFDEFDAMSSFIADRMGKYIKFLDNFHPKSPHYKDRLKKKFKLSDVIPDEMIQNTSATIIDLIKKRGTKSIFKQLLKENDFNLSFERLVIVNNSPLLVIGEDSEKIYDPLAISNKLGIDFNGIQSANLPIYTSIYVVKDPVPFDQDAYIKKFKKILDIMNFDNNPIFDENCSNGLTFRENYNFVCMIESVINNSFIGDVEKMMIVPSSLLSPMDPKYKNSMFVCYSEYAPTMAEINEICHEIFKSNMYSPITLTSSTNPFLTEAIQTDINNNMLYSNIALITLAQNVELSSYLTKSSNEQHSYHYYLEKEYDMTNVFYSVKKKDKFETYRKLLLYYQSVLNTSMMQADSIKIYETLRAKYNEINPLNKIIGPSASVPGETVIRKGNIKIDLDFSRAIYDKKLSLKIIDQLTDYIPMNVQFLNYDDIATIQLPTIDDSKGIIGYGDGEGHAFSTIKYEHSISKYVDPASWISLSHEIILDSTIENQ